MDHIRVNTKYTQVNIESYLKFKQFAKNDVIQICSKNKNWNWIKLNWKYKFKFIFGRQLKYPATW